RRRRREARGAAPAPRRGPRDPGRARRARARRRLHRRRGGGPRRRARGGSMSQRVPNGPRRCQACGATARRHRPALARPSVAEEIRHEHPDWKEDGFICHDDLARYRMRHVEGILEGERGELTELERQVIESLSRHEILAANVDAEFEGELTRGERLADRLAEFGGSWRFILLFGGALAFWILLNTALVVFGR